MNRLALFALICLAATGCRKSGHDQNVVKETYIHKYGVPMTKSDWEKQGKEGKTVSLRKDGVTVTTVYSNGIPHGPTSYTFPNSSTVQYIETYSNGDLVAKRESYPSGVAMKEEAFEDYNSVKLSRWYEDGTPQSQEKFQGIFLVAAEYRNPLNVIESRIQEGHGIRIRRSPNGDLLSKDTIQNGEMCERVTYFANGDPASVTPYENGVVHGTRLSFLQGGLPSSVEQWAKGVQEGITVLYQNGEKIAEIPYSHGRKNGIELRYRDGSLLVEEISWQNNVQHGQCKLFIDGETRSEWYHEGELVSRPTFERLNWSRKAA